MANEKDNKEGSLANDAIEDKPENKAGVLAALLSFVKKLSIGTDLTSQSLSLPEGIEGRDSGLERFQAIQLKHSDLLLEVNEIEDPVMRLVQVVKWVLTLGQGFQMKKPLNPVLGEVSVCKFYSNQKDGENKERDESNAFHGIAEQISHHPPKSAIYAENKEKGVKIESSANPSVRFLGTAIKLAVDGKTSVTFEKFNEVYSYSPPPVMIRLVGFVLEYAGTTVISCDSHPYFAEITYKEKPYLRGKYHAIKGKIVKANKKGGDEDVIKFKGHWNQEVKFEDLRTKTSFSLSNADYAKIAGTPVYPSVENELPQSTRKVWHHLKVATDGSTVAKAKKEVEEEQRRKAKERLETGEEHQVQFFVRDDKEEDVEVWRLKDDALGSIMFA